MKSILILFVLITNVLAKTKFEWFTHAKTFYACMYEINFLRNMRFCGSVEEDCLCSCENALATVAGCITYKNRNRTKEIDYVGAYCHKFYNIDLDPDWFSKSLAFFNKNAKKVEDIGENDQTAPLQVPLRFENNSMDFYEEVTNRFLLNYDYSIWYGVSVFGFWLVVLLIYMFGHWTKVLFPGIAKRFTFPIANFYRKHVSMPALYGKHKSQALSFWKVFVCLFPTRFESIVIALFYVFITIIHAVNTQGLPSDPVFGSKYLADLRYVADRTGIVATFMMPLLFLFSGRNNLLQWICGINYSTFSCYHRHIARVMFILVVIHSVNYTILVKSYYADEAKHPWFYWGVIATIVGALLLMQSILYLRRNYYEVFLLLHIVMAALYVAGTWVHIAEFGYEIYLYPTVAVWCLDRLARICRLFAFGFPEATIMLQSTDGTIRLLIPMPKHWKIVPGGYAFVHFLRPGYFWQSHPFTFTNTTQDEENLIMYMKVKGGMTHSLYRLLKKSPENIITMRVGVEGPYGGSSPAKYADKAVFIAGGNGIPGIYSEVLDIGLKSSKKSLKLIWIVREYGSVYRFFYQLRKLKETNIEATVYVTRPKKPADISASKENTKNELTKTKSSESNEFREPYRDELSHIQFGEGRPNIELLIQEEIKSSPGSIAFVACGVPVMVDDVRYYCRNNIDNSGKKRVDFYDQLQIWA
ncbi:uncharacterized protein SPAPADRAFT_146155 [Spathaspora passalidarum NRRL Y-27907]|uniref:ferric-chelate reductase (NADPH) n=1 Tax=Spathaspora passalidarum (strain NRRL Y-27907 / 11-Y1) TaxID=619300 RepID=G3AG49_SPAPN|nr:uncharacterized protein SPAPADRAFT_146155 [Spathaspora passalidarum NRRL Y-27907]EGW35188.1 hypothetical protein SPAPADRAFT_146155 [Spathaspora passalidarum NRRL Y-27907]